MNLDLLNTNARKMVAPGKGILAADESTGTIGKRLASIGAANTEDNRRAWREMLFRTKQAMEDNISGVILYDETIRQNAADGTPLRDLIKDSGALIGIKVDTGAKPMALRPGETITEGLDGLRGRLAEYFSLGARFAKWRAVITIGNDGRPSRGAVTANAEALARYAALCQEANIVPIVEPELLMDGPHGVQEAYEVTENVLRMIYRALYDAGVQLEGTILKPNMVVSGNLCETQACIDEVAERTNAVLLDAVPASVPGIAFLSGGQTSIDATAHLDAMNKIGNLPWALTFSYGRALQADALSAWGGKNVAAGQAAFTHRAKMNGLAAKGEWDRSLEG